MKILVVDDNEGYLNLLGDVIQEYGHHVLLATDGKQAREFLQVEPVDAIVSDVYMPNLDGMRFHSYVRDFMGQQEIPFIFVSGYADEDTRNSILTSDRDFFFDKSVPMSEVMAVLQRFDAQRV